MCRPHFLSGLLGISAFLELILFHLFSFSFSNHNKSNPPHKVTLLALSTISHKTDQNNKKCIPHIQTFYKWDRSSISKECREAIQHTILQKFHTEPTTFNLVSFKFYRANGCKNHQRGQKKLQEKLREPTEHLYQIENSLGYDSKNS